MLELRSLPKGSVMAQAPVAFRGLLTFEVCHVCPNITVEGIDHHFAIRRSCNLDPAIDETWGRRGPLPRIVVSDVLGLGKKIGKHTSVELLLTDHSSLEQRLSGLVESSVKESEESSGFGGENLLLGVVDSAMDGDALVDSFDVSHDEGMCVSVRVMDL